MGFPLDTPAIRRTDDILRSAPSDLDRGVGEWDLGYERQRAALVKEKC